MKPSYISFLAVGIVFAFGTPTNAAMIVPGSVCSAVYTNQTDPSRRADNNTGAVAIVFGRSDKATLYIRRGVAAFAQPPKQLDAFDDHWNVQLVPTESGYTTAYQTSRTTGGIFTVQVTLTSKNGIWTIAMLPALPGAITATGSLSCGTKPFER